jgi:hypothetical protein
MNNIRRNIIRHASSFMVFFVFSLVVAGGATAALYRDHIPVPFSQIVWDHQDVSGWPITSDLHKVYISGDGQINMPHTQTCSWPLADSATNANSWVIRKTSDNKWHASTWDFMRRCQTTKSSHDVGADDGWRPRDGEEIYIFISGIARPGYEHLSNVQERTNIVRYIWNGPPGDALPALPACNDEPDIVSFESSPSLINVGQSVTLSWKINEADAIGLVTEKGVKIDVSQKDPKSDSVTLTLQETTTFILVAANSCVDVTPPSSTITVRVTKGLTWLPMLLLNR